MAKQAYSYEDFLQAARAQGMMESFSPADLKLAQASPEAGMSLLSYKTDYAAATTDEARALANAGAERTRANYGGYTAGENGQGYYLNGSREGNYVNQFAAEQQALGDRIAQEFRYDRDADPLWQDYRRQDQADGERAYRNSLAEAAANTGGIASTAAVTAAQQAQNYYAAQAAAKKAELYQQAYDNWLSGRQSDMQAAQLYDQLHQSQAAQRQQVYENAMEKWKSYGYVTEDIAQALVLPVGTAYTEQAYNEWYQAFQEAQSGVFTGLTQYDQVNLGQRAAAGFRDSASAHKSVGMGSHSLDVQTMQTYLNQLGYSCGADGLFGGETLRALQQFQKDHGVYVDGICGPVTWTALINAMGQLNG